MLQVFSNNMHFFLNPEKVFFFPTAEEFVSIKWKNVWGWAKLTRDRVTSTSEHGEGEKLPRDGVTSTSEHGEGEKLPRDRVTSTSEQGEGEKLPRDSVTSTS